MTQIKIGHSKFKFFCAFILIILFQFSIGTAYAAESRKLKKIVKITLNNNIHAIEIYEKKLGKGAYGNVHLARDLNTREWLAAKIQPYAVPADIKHEIIVLSMVDEYRGDTTIKENNSISHYLFMKLAPGDCIEKTYSGNKKLSQTEILRILHSSLVALKKLHDQNIIHSDLHEGNLIYDSKTNQAHWIDFAYALQLEPGMQATPVRIVSKSKNPPRHKAPESNFERGFKTDTYQLGFMAMRFLMIHSEKNPAIRAKMIKSRDYSYTLIIQRLKNNSSFTSNKNRSNMDKVFRVLSKMVNSNKNARPNLTQSIMELEENM